MAGGTVRRGPGGAGQRKSTGGTGGSSMIHG